jgi:hypothetical protein
LIVEGHIEQHGRAVLSLAQTVGLRPKPLGEHVARALGEIEAGRPLLHGPAEGGVEIVAQHRAGEGQAQAEAAFGPALDDEGVVDVSSRGRVDADKINTERLLP